MLSASEWVLGAVVAVGLGLSCFYLQERPIRGGARLVSWAHGAGGAIGVLLLIVSVSSAPAHPGEFGWFAAGGAAAALLAGLVILTMQLRRGRPAGLVVALHATLGIAAFVILLAYASTNHL